MINAVATETHAQYDDPNAIRSVLVSAERADRLRAHADQLHTRAIRLSQEVRDALELLLPQYEKAHRILRRVLRVDRQRISMNVDETYEAAGIIDALIKRMRVGFIRVDAEVPYEEWADGTTTLPETEPVSAAVETTLLELINITQKQLDINRNGHPMPRIEDPQFDPRAEAVEIGSRVGAAVVVSGAPNAAVHDLAGTAELHTVAKLKEMPQTDFALYAKGSKRDDIATATNGHVLEANLQGMELDPQTFEVVTLRLSGKAVTLVLPRGTQMLAGVQDLFAEVGIVMEPAEAADARDMFYLGIPDEAFEGVEGRVQMTGDERTVDGRYKRFRHIRDDGRLLYAVGSGEAEYYDGTQLKRVILDYFGPFKKGPWEQHATRQVADATQLLADAGMPVVQPPSANYRFEPRAPLPKEEAFKRMKIPFHGTTAVWGKQGTPEEVAAAIEAGATGRHMLFEGQSGMGKSEMQCYIDNMLALARRAETLATDPALRDRLAAVDGYQLHSSGDDMGQLETRMNETTGARELVSRTHERARFTRLDNLPDRPGIEERARKTLEVNRRTLEPNDTPNARVLERDPMLERLHQIPLRIDTVVAATNIDLDIEGLVHGQVIQKVDAATYARVYGGYSNRTNGTKNGEGKVKSPTMGHEFFGKDLVAGTEHCENLVAARRFMTQMAMGNGQQLDFYVINSGIKPAWADAYDYEENAKDPKRKNRNEKMRFANAADAWAQVEGLMPEPVRQSLLALGEATDMSLGELVYATDGMGKDQLENFLQARFS